MKLWFTNRSFPLMHLYKTVDMRSNHFPLSVHFFFVIDGLLGAACSSRIMVSSHLLRERMGHELQCILEMNRKKSDMEFDNWDEQDSFIHIRTIHLHNQVPLPLLWLSAATSANCFNSNPLPLEQRHQMVADATSGNISGSG